MKFKRVVSSIILMVLISMSLILCSSPSIKQNQYTYTSDDVVTLYGEVNDTTAEQVILKIRKIQNDSDKPIYFFINSPGGSVFAGARIIDAMVASKRPVYTIDIGVAASMAAFIHSYGEKRFMLPHAILMYHNAAGDYSGDIAKIQSRLIMIQTIMTDFNLNLSKKTGIPLNEIMAKENAEWWVLSGEALNKKFVDSVINTVDFPIAVPDPEK